MNNRKIRHLRLLLGTILCLSMQSCNEFLDEKPSKSSAIPETLDDVQAMLDYQVVMNFRVPSMGEHFIDDFYVPDAQYNRFSVTDREAYTWSLRHYEYSNHWASAYNVVYRANMGLEILDKIGRNPSDASRWDQLRGTAIFFRAYSYLMLVWLHGPAYDESTASRDPGIVLPTGTDVNAVSVRATVKECYDRIISEFEQAATLLPESQAPTTRPTRFAAHGMLARAYLSMRRYEDALTHSDLCLQRYAGAVLDYNTDITVKEGQALTFTPYNREEIFTSRMSQFQIVAGSNTNARVDSVLYASYADGDIRKRAFFFASPDGIRYKGQYAPEFTRFCGIAVPEMMLTASECMIRSGNVEQGLELLMELLQRRYENGAVPDVGTTALEFVLGERRKELIFRGLRFMDIKRLNKETSDIIVRRRVNGELITIPPNDARYALPLPADIVALTGMPQNPD